MEKKPHRAPCLFIGHGSPMNALEINEFTQQWKACVTWFSQPRAIVVISAHWYTDKTRINNLEQPKLIYDMYGFPKALYDMPYPAKNDLEVVKQIQSLLGNELIIDNAWGYDHGVWAILTHMYPKANIPIIPLSINYQLPPEAHYELGQKLKTLREQGIMILGSGNVVHNLAIMNWGLKGGYAWADTFDTYIIQQIKKRNHQGVIHYQQAGPSSKMAFYTPEHYDPLLYVLGASDENDEMMVFNDKRIMGAISMTCYLFQ